MSRAAKILEQMDRVCEELLPFSVDAVKAAWTAKLREFSEYSDVIVEDASVNDDGTTTVAFCDSEGDSVDVVFGVDEDGPYCVASSDVAESDIDLSPLGPGMMENQFFSYLDVTDLGWVNKSTMSAILGSAGVGPDASVSNEIAFGEAIGNGAKPKKVPNIRSVKSKACEALDESVDEAINTTKVIAGYHRKGTIKIGMTKEADGMLQKVVGFTDIKGDKADNPLINKGKMIPGVWLKPEWKEIKKLRTVRKQRHIVTAGQLARSAKTRARNAILKQRLAPAAAPAA